jgi:hypothetical protein
LIYIPDFLFRFFPSGKEAEIKPSLPAKNLTFGVLMKKRAIVQTFNQVRAMVGHSWRAPVKQNHQ